MSSLIKAIRKRQPFEWGRKSNKVLIQRQLQPFVLPSLLPPWPPGTGFATGTIVVGEIQLAQLSTFENVWIAYEGGYQNRGAAFLKPINIPPDYSCLGYYSQPNAGVLDGWVLVAKESASLSGAVPGLTMGARDNSGNTEGEKGVVSQEGSLETVPNNGISKTSPPPLASPTGYTLIWSSNEWSGKSSGSGYFWLPSPPDGYKAVGYVVTKTAESPSTQEVMCIRSDLTDACVIYDSIWTASTNPPFSAWTLKPLVNGTEAKGIAVGTFYCGKSVGPESGVPIACLKNTDLNLSAMPNIDQLHALVSQYGPTVFFHSDEQYFPSSISWFFGKGALLYSKGEAKPVEIALDGSNLPVGGTNDGEYWIDLPSNGSADEVKKGDLASAEVYIHVKPMFGGTFTDLAMWVYYPFNGPSTAKFGLINVHLGKIGEHVSDWEHFTLRISNFTGEMMKIYFAQHSGGTWLKASEVEYTDGNKAVVFSSKNGHACYPHPGLVLQGDQKAKVGIRNDTGKSKYSLDCSKNYKIISAEYLLTNTSNTAPIEPVWLQYMRQWGPKIQYDSSAELQKVLKRLPSRLRSPLRSLFNKFPNELSGEEGPTGPKQKNNWAGDEK